MYYVKLISFSFEWFSFSGKSWFVKNNILDIFEIWKIYQCFSELIYPNNFCINIFPLISLLMKFIFEVIILKFHKLHSEITKREHENLSLTYLWWIKINLEYIWWRFKWFCSYQQQLHLFLKLKIYITKEMKILQNEITNDKQREILLFIKNNSICLSCGTNFNKLNLY